MMKKIYAIIMVACAMMFAGCQKDFDGIFNAEIASLESNNGKVHLDSENFACWDDGDEVAVYENRNDEYANWLTNVSSVSVKNETTTIGPIEEVQENGWIEVVYPRESRPSLEPCVYINPIQNYDEIDANVQKINAPMVAKTILKSGSNTLKFFNLASLLRIEVKNNTTVPIDLSRIVLTAYSEDGNEVQANGHAVYDQADNNAPYNFRFSDNGSNSVALIFGNNGATEKSIDVNGSFVCYMYVAPITCKYNVSVYRNAIVNSRVIENKIYDVFSGVKSFEGNHMYPMTITLSQQIPSAE